MAPSPKSQDQESGWPPVVSSVNCTVSGAMPTSGVAEKSGLRTVPSLTTQMSWEPWFVPVTSPFALDVDPRRMYPPSAVCWTDAVISVVPAEQSLPLDRAGAVQFHDPVVESPWFVPVTSPLVLDRRPEEDVPAVGGLLDRVPSSQPLPPSRSFHRIAPAPSSFTTQYVAIAVVRAGDVPARARFE